MGELKRGAIAEYFDPISGPSKLSQPAGSIEPMDSSAVAQMPTINQSLEQAARTAWHADPVAVVLFAVVAAAPFVVAGWRAGSRWS